MPGTLTRLAELPAPGPAWVEARERVGLTQVALAIHAGVDEKTVRNLERPGTRDVRMAIRRVVALELWVANDWRDPFSVLFPSEEAL